MADGNWHGHRPMGAPPTEFEDSGINDALSHSLIPGFVEYLESLLTGPDGTQCPHRNKIDPDRALTIPERLCFFSQRATHDRNLLHDIFYIDTEDLCTGCYALATPKGFNVWSTTYFDKYDEALDKDNQATPRAAYPRMLQATYGGRHRFDFWSDQGFKPRFPGAAIAHEAWRWLVWVHAPFYIDQLCINPPYNPNLRSGSREEIAEGDRVSRLNTKAYTGCHAGIIATPLGGAGEYSMAEQRLLGDQRMICIPYDFGEASAIEELGSGYLVYGDTHWVPQLYRTGGKINLDFYNGFRAQFQAAQTQYPVPPSARVNALARDSNGRALPPTRAEMERRQGDVSRTFDARRFEQLKECYKTMMDPSSSAPNGCPDFTQKQTSRRAAPTGGAVGGAMGNFDDYGGGPSGGKMGGYNSSAGQYDMFAADRARQKMLEIRSAHDDRGFYANDPYEQPRYGRASAPEDEDEEAYGSYDSDY